MSGTYEYPDGVIHAATERNRLLSEALWALMQRWYDVVADENYSDATRNRYRECANELDDALGAWSAKPTAGLERKT
jgi:hypothetical protein